MLLAGQPHYITLGAHSHVVHDTGNPCRCARFFPDGLVLVLRTFSHDLLFMTQPHASAFALYNQSESWVGQELVINIFNIHFWENRDAQAAVDFSSKMDLLTLLHSHSLHQKINGSDTSAQKTLSEVGVPEFPLPRASCLFSLGLLSQFLMQVELYHCSLTHPFL